MTISLHVDSRGVAAVMLDRPDKHNALSGQMIADLTATAKTIAANPDIRVVVLRGQGASFCAGGDLQWLQDQIAAGPDARRAGIAAIADMLMALNTLPQPLIARVHGNTFGTGVALMCVCDAVIAVNTAKFGITETKLGLTPGALGPFIVARMGEANARAVFMSSRVFDASEAEKLGAVTRAVPVDMLDAAVTAEVDPYLQCAPGAVAAAKAQLRSLGPKIDAEIIAASIEATIKDWDGPEVMQGIAAFLTKTSPPWVK